MLISAPRVKNRMPTTIMAAPSRKHSRMLEEMGATVKQSSSTMATTGSTDVRDSRSFSRMVCRNAVTVEPFPLSEAASGRRDGSTTITDSF